MADKFARQWVSLHLGGWGRVCDAQIVHSGASQTLPQAPLISIRSKLAHYDSRQPSCGID